MSNSRTTPIVLFAGGAGFLTLTVTEGGPEEVVIGRVLPSGMLQVIVGSTEYLIDPTDVKGQVPYLVVANDLTGTATVGSTLTPVAGVWVSDGPLISGVIKELQRDGVLIAGEDDGSTYVVQAPTDEGTELVYYESAENAYGTSESWSDPKDIPAGATLWVPTDMPEDMLHQFRSDGTVGALVTNDITESSGTVQNWRNLLGSGGGSTHAGRLFSAGPTVLLADTNGLNALDFGTADRGMSFAKLTLANSGVAFGVFVAYGPVAYNGRAIITIGSHATGHIIIYGDTDDELLVRCKSTHTFSTGRVAQAGGVVGLVHTASSTFDNLDFCWNGAVQANIAAGVGAWDIGGSSNRISQIGPSGSGNQGGRIFEIVTILGVVSTDTRDRVMGCLAHKWGLDGALIAGPYTASPPYV